jgi:hypothetical protein
MIVDVHTHIYPKIYIPRLKALSAQYDFEVKYGDTELPTIY